MRRLRLVSDHIRHASVVRLCQPAGALGYPPRFRVVTELGAGVRLIRRSPEPAEGSPVADLTMLDDIVRPVRAGDVKTVVVSRVAGDGGGVLALGGTGW